MNVDYEMGNDSEFVPPSPSQLPSSQWHTQDADTDLVKWQGSQTSSVALNALLKEAAKPIRRSPRNYRTQQICNEPIPGPSFSGSSRSSSAPTSGSNSLFNSRSRASRARTRHPSAQVASASFLTSTPASSIPSDPTQFLQTLKGVSEKVKVDESARAMKRLSSREVKGLGSKSTGIRMRKEKDNLRRSTTGVKESDKSKSPVRESRSLPIMGGRDMEADGHTEVDESTTFQIDVDMDVAAGPSYRRSPYDEHAIVPTLAPGPQPRRILSNISSHMPPPPVPAPKVQPLPPPRDHPKSTWLFSNPIPLPSTPKSTSPQRAPPLPADTHPQASPLPSSNHSQRPSYIRPPNSQLTSRPPALGMRQSLTTYSSLAPSQTLPEKQRGFKVPLAKPSLPPVPVFSTPPSTASYQRHSIQVSRVLPTPEPSPPNSAKKMSNEDGREVGTQHSSSPATDADSSYGDMSFDMDALEETMKKYD